MPTEADAAFRLYQYKAQPLYVVDGDTIDLDVDLGFEVRFKMRIRLLGIDAPERGDHPGYDNAKDFLLLLKEHCNTGSSQLYIRTVKDKHDVYGRYLANLWEITTDGYTTDISAKMLSEGLAKPYVP